MSRSLSWNEVTAVLGGTFDPPHLGHREVVRGLFENPAVRRVLVVPTGTPPMKSGATSAEHRARMTELSFAGLERFGEVRIDRRELERTAQTGKPSYTFDTLLELGREIPKLAFVVGVDQLTQLHVWHRFPELLGVAHWIVLARKDGAKTAPGETALQTLRQWETSGLIRHAGKGARADAGEWVTSTGKGPNGETRLILVETPAPALSSSEVREQIARSTSARELNIFLESRLLPSVRAYLMENGLYGISGSQRGVSRA